VLIRRLDPETFLEAYGIDIQLLYPWEGTVETPFGAAWAVVPPGGSTKHHNHQEGETFFIARGQGVMEIEGEKLAVGSGDVTFHRPFQKHTLTNTSDTEDLLFLTVWWEDKELWAEPGAAERAETAAPLKRALVTAAPPTPNGDLHLGHLSGPYLAADIHTRYRRLRGGEAFYACGSDDNSEYVKSMGASIGMGPEEAARHFVSQIEQTLDAAEIGMEIFMHPNESPHHRGLVQDFFRRLYETGHLEEREVDSPWCESCDRYLFEPYVGGRCPHCGSGVVGNTCEDCGRVNDAHNVVDATCTLCGSPPVPRPTKRLFFPLSRHADMLRDYHRRVHMSPHLRAFCEKLLADGLPDVAVTHRTDWGIEVPLPGWEEQRIYVWLEMAPRYFSYCLHVGDKVGGEGGWERFWRSDDAEVVQCFGFDNSFYYACFLPALFQAFDGEIRLPVAFITNEFYRLDGLKFSTSRKHLIGGRELVGRVPADMVRFYLAWSGPETEGTNFTQEDFQATLRRELLGGWQPWLAGLGAKVARELGGAVPSTGDWMPQHRHFYRALERLMEEAAIAYSAANFSPQRATRLMSELVRMARRFGAAEEHWAGVPERGEERRTGIALEALAAKLLAILAAPVMPRFAERLWKQLGYGGKVEAGTWEEKPDWLPAGQKIHLEGPWFPEPELPEILGSRVAVKA